MNILMPHSQKNISLMRLNVTATCKEMSALDVMLELIFKKLKCRLRNNTA